MQKQCTKVASGNWDLYNISKYANLPILKCAYYSLVYSYLQCASVCGQTSKAHLKLILTLQNKAI